MSKKIVKRFADSKTIYEGNYPVKNQKYTHWVEYTDGTKEDIGEETISGLWNHWITAKDAYKYEENGFTVFEYTDR